MIKANSKRSVKTLSTHIALLVGILSGGALNAQHEIDLNMTKVYSSVSADRTGRLVVIPHNKKDYYYLYFDGFDGVFDNNSGVYSRNRNHATRSRGFYYNLAGTNRIVVRNDQSTTLIGGTQTPYLTLQHTDHGPIKLIHKGRTGLFEARRIRETYAQSQGFLTSKIKSIKHLESAFSKFRQQCSSSADLISSETASIHKDAYVLYAKHFDSLSVICKIDQDHLNAVQAISHFHLKYSNSNNVHQVELTNDSMTISLDEHAPNIRTTSYKKIIDSL